MSAHFLRLKSLSQKSTRSAGVDFVIPRVMAHNLREIAAKIGVSESDHIDPARTKDNIILEGHATSGEVDDAVKTLMKSARVRRWQKNTVIAIEVVISLPDDSEISPKEYFSGAVSWAKKFFNVPIVSAVIHLDEQAPHCHVIMIPIINGQLSGSKVTGNRDWVLSMHDDFHTNVAKKYGLARPSRQKRPSAAVRREAIDIAFNVLEANSGLEEHVIRALLKPHCNDPTQLFEDMGLELPKPKSKETFAGIMTKPCKPDTPKISKQSTNSIPIAIDNLKPIGNPTTIEPQNSTQKSKSYALLGITFAEPVISPSSPPPNPLNQAQPAPLPNNEPIPQTIQLTEPAPPEQDYIEHITRFSDNDQQASGWDYETGQFQEREQIQKFSNRQVAKNSVNLLLKNIRNRTGINRHLII